MEYKAPKLKLKKQKTPKADVMKAELSMTGIDGGEGEAKMAGKKPGKIMRIKSGKVSDPSAKQLKLMRKDYERGTSKEGKYQMEKKRLKKEREMYDKILRIK